MARFVSSAAACPYYKLEDATMVQCEGLVEAGNIKVCYKSSEDAQEHIDRYCHGDWRSCRIAAMLERKYEDGAG